MKKIASIGLVAIFSSLIYAENIDGTLSVDSNNALTSAKQNADNTLSANLNNASNYNKEEEVATTTPASPIPNNLNEGPFVGLELSAVLSSDTVDGSNSGLGYGIRFGAQNTEWRTMAILESFGSDDDLNNYVRGILQVDYYFLGQDNLMIDTYAIRPYAGVNAGGLSIDTNTENIKTITYGGQIGATMNVLQNIDLDVGYRYNLAGSSKVDHTSEISVGLHYKY